MKYSILSILLSSLISISVSSYNEEIGIKLWGLCRMTYCGQNMIENLSCGPMCDELKTSIKDLVVIHRDDTKLLIYAFFDKRDSNVYLAYRGTNNLINWIQDFEAWLTDYPKCPDCKVHRGFLEDTNDLTSDIKKSLTEISKKNGNVKNLIVTGHSLGAALATLGVAELYEDFNILYHYNFGCPRIGNKHFAEWFNKIPIQDKFRVVHDKDIVPHAAPKLFGYYHTNSEVWYYSDKLGDIKICEKLEDNKCSDSLFFYNWSDHTSYYEITFNDHNLNKYCNPDKHFHNEIENSSVIKDRIKNLK